MPIALHAATDIIDRALTQADTATPIAGERPTPQIATTRELLDDLDEVLGADPVPAGEVIGALRTLAPTWQPYRELTVPRLVAALGALGIKVPATGNRYPIDPAAVRRAHAALPAATAQDGDEPG